MSNFDIFEGSMATTDFDNQQNFPAYDDLELFGFAHDNATQELCVDSSSSTLDLFHDFMTFPSHDTVDLLARSDNGENSIELFDLKAYQSYQSGDAVICCSSYSPSDFLPSQRGEVTNPYSSGSSPVNFVPLPVENTLFENPDIRKSRKRSACEPISPDTMMENAFPFFSSVPLQTKPTGSKSKRRRVQNARQRKEANVRERNRMERLNGAIDGLKAKVPTFSYENRLSRIETLRLATQYISFMTEILAGNATPKCDNS